MNKAKLVAFVLAITAAAIQTAHAAQVAGEKCADEINGTFGETTSHQAVICSDGKWQDPKAVPMASVNVSKVSAAKTLEVSYDSVGFVGTRRFWQRNDGQGQLTMIATVAAFNADNTAHVVLEVVDADGPKIVDTIVPLDAATVVRTDNQGAEYSLTVKRKPV